MICVVLLIACSVLSLFVRDAGVVLVTHSRNILSNADDFSCKVGTVRVQATFLNAMKLFA